MLKVGCCRRHSWYRTWCARRFSAIWAIGTHAAGSWFWAWPCGVPQRWSARSCRRICRLLHSGHWSVSARPRTAPLRQQSSRTCSSTTYVRRCWPCFTSPYQSAQAWGKSNAPAIPSESTCNGRYASISMTISFIFGLRIDKSDKSNRAVCLL